MKDLYDYEVYDRYGKKIGSVENVWADENQNIRFIGVSTGWMGMGKSRLIPEHDFTIDEQAHAVRVPYDEETVKNSPSIESESELGGDVEKNLYSHYGLEGSTPPATGSRTGQTADWDTGAGARAESRTGETADWQAGAGARTESNTQGSEYLGQDKSVQVPLAEEKMNVQKRETNLGEVRLRKVVRTETVNQPVELRHEDVIVERVSGSGARPGEDAFSERVVTIPVMQEEAVMEKTVQSAGAVEAKKVLESEQKNVSGTVRKEDVEVERDFSKERKDKPNNPGK